MVQERVQKNVDGMHALLRCRSLPELLAAQSALFQENLELTLSNSRRLTEASVKLAEKFPRTFTVQSAKNASRTA
jgi:hypothetical protein